MDPVGKAVRDLDVSKETEAGLHRVTWDLVGGALVAAKKGGMDPDAPQKGGKGAKGEKAGKGAKGGQGGGKGGGAANSSSRASMPWCLKRMEESSANC